MIEDEADKEFREVTFRGMIFRTQYRAVMSEKVDELKINELMESGDTIHIDGWEEVSPEEQIVEFIKKDDQLKQELKEEKRKARIPLFGQLGLVFMILVILKAHLDYMGIHYCDGLTQGQCEDKAEADYEAARADSPLP